MTQMGTAKSEARNPKEIQNITDRPTTMFQTGGTDSEFWIFPVRDLFDLVCFGFRASGFGF
jgi:hypothetical protein